MFFNYKIKEDCQKAQDFLMANDYAQVVNKLSKELITKYIHKNTKRVLFTTSLLPPLKPGSRILEIGAVPYCFSTLFSELYSSEVTTIDLPLTLFPGEPYKMEKEEIVIPNSITDKKYKIVSWTCNAEKDTFPLADKSFDLVICTEVLEHLIYSPAHVIKESFRVLKNGGNMLVSTVNSLHFKRMADLILNENIDDNYSVLGPYGRHNKYYTRTELIHLAESHNFKVRFVTTASLRGTRNESEPVPGEKQAGSGRKEKKQFSQKLGKLARKMFLNLVKILVHLPLPGLKDKRHYNIFLLLEK